MKRLALALPVILLAGCGGVSSWPTGSYVTIDAQDAAVVTPAIAEYLAATLQPQARVTLPPASPGDPVRAPLTEALARDGIYPGENGRRVQYVVTPMDDGVLVHIAVDGGLAAGSRFFARAPNGSLTPAGPMMELSR